MLLTLRHKLVLVCRCNGCIKRESSSSIKLMKEKSLDRSQWVCVNLTAMASPVSLWKLNVSLISGYS